MRAVRTFKDDFDILRKNGEEWLIRMSDTEVHIPNVYEEVCVISMTIFLNVSASCLWFLFVFGGQLICVVNITTLTNRQYAVILDPVDEKGKPQMGRRKLIKGEVSFFLMPGESLEKGIQNVYVLGENEGLILRATEMFKDGVRPVSFLVPSIEVSFIMWIKPVCLQSDTRNPGDLWMIRGPIEYVPPVEVEVVTKRVAIPLDENEGIYVRDVRSGRVRAITGVTYMLNQDEELWSKDLPPGVEALLAMEKDPLADRGYRGKAGESGPRPRDKTRVVTFRVPHNAAVQIYDYTAKKAR